MRKSYLILLPFVLLPLFAGAQEREGVKLEINSTKVTGKIDPLLYGQLFEHIYFSANNGVWQELIFERSFETEHFPGIPPRDGYFVTVPARPC